MDNKIKIIAILENNIIQGFKVNDYLFFKHENENEIDFCNKRVIPLLREKGIDFFRYYNDGYVDVVQKDDYIIKYSDQMILSKKQLGSILTANNQRELNYDEQLYVIKYYERNFADRYDNRTNRCFEKVQKSIMDKVVSDFYDNDFEKVLEEYFTNEEEKIIKDNQTLMIIDDKIIYNWNTRNIKSSLDEIRRNKELVNRKTKERLEYGQSLSNVKTYVNNCREDVLSGRQINLSKSSYSYGNMYGVSNVGKRRETQEDSYVVLEHPQNKKVKFLAVADGMGGHESGEIVSNHTVKKLIEWFESQDVFTINNINELKMSINKYLSHILDDLVIQDGDSTLVMAVVGEEQTLIINIGDSRVYTIKNGKMKQETKDQSRSQTMVDLGKIDEEFMRFYKHNNQVNNGVRVNSYYKEADYKIISNQTYDKILLVSDGVSDCLSNAQIEKLMRISKKGKVAENIVEAALDNESILPREYRGNPDYMEYIPGGKDNTTAVYYDSEEIPEYKHR